MTRQEFAKACIILQTEFEGFELIKNKERFNMWFEMFVDEEYEVFVTAIKKYVLTSPFKPTVAALREQIMLIKNPYTDFTCEDSWKEVQDAIRYCGYYNELEAMARMSPITQSIVRSLGYKYLCTSEDQMADRAHFIKMFDAHSKREKDNLMLPSSVKNETLRLRNGMLKMLGDGMDMNKII